MIIVDINVVIFDKFYDFELNEDAKVREVIEEIVHMIEQKEKTGFTGSISDLILFDRKNKKVLNLDYSVAQQAIVSGGSLSLI